MVFSFAWHRLSGKASRSIVTALWVLVGANAQAYDLRITNRTALGAQGQVTYTACKPDNYAVAPGQTWTSNSRGLCLITGISAAMQAAASGQQVAPVTAYSSSGTAYGDFSITQSGTSYRVWSAAELAQQPAPQAMAPTGPTVRWQAVAAGQAPPADALKGGRQRFGGKVDAAGKPEYHLLPVCRGQSNGVFAIGNAAPFYRNNGGWSWNEYRCYVFLDNKEQELASYEVLIVDPQVVIRNANAVRWVGATNGAVPAGAFDAAKAAPALQACRAQYVDGDTWVRVGTLGQGACFFPYGGQARRADAYEVLVVDGAASQPLARGVNEPRLAAEPDRPALARGAAVKDIAALGAYKINAVAALDSSKREVLYKKTLGGIWEEHSSDAFTSGVEKYVRPYVEVERNDSAVILYSGTHKQKVLSQTRTLPAQTISLGVNDGVVVAHPMEKYMPSVATAPRGSDLTQYEYRDSSTYMARAMRAEPDTVASFVMKPVNAAQTSTLWKSGNLPGPFLRGQDGGFGNYKVASSGDGWLELYTVATQTGGKWSVHFLKLDFWRNRVWELWGVTDRQPATQDAGALRALAKSTSSTNAWAEAYELTEASVFTGANIGAALGRLAGTQQIGWTLREEVGGTTLRWEELKNDVKATSTNNVKADLYQIQKNESQSVGRMLTEVGRTASTLTLTGSELGSPLVIDWVNGTLTAGGKKVGDFLKGDSEFPGQRKKVPAPVAPGIAPGFQFVNKTDWPVLVKIGQVGCLYHGVIPPRTSMIRDTGAVWFTLSAEFALDGKDLTQEQVFTDCAAPVYFATMGVIATAATGGTAGGVIALAAASAGTMGAATTATAFLDASGASQLTQDAVAASIYIVGGGLTGAARGAARVVSTKLTTGMTRSGAAAKIASTVAGEAAREGADAAWEELKTYGYYWAPNMMREAQANDYAALNSWFADKVTLAGQYAGYPWPWKMKDRVMPQYEITGGPRIDTLRDGSKLIRKDDKNPFAMKRVN